MLEKFRKQYQRNEDQYVLVDSSGVILQSDQILFHLNIGDSIFELDAFFESLPFNEKPTENVKFLCIHLVLHGKTFIVDIEMLYEKEGCLLIISDYTEHYNSYQEITQKRNESVIKSELTVLKNLQLEERERFKNQFIQNFSHELRNPMASMMAIIDLIDETKLTNEQSKMLNFLKESNTNLRLMLEDTLSMGMIDAGKLEIQEKLFGLHDLLELIKFTYTTKAKKEGLNFNCNWDESLPEHVEGDRLRLFQILTNLLDNAIKFTESGNFSLKVNINQKRANTINLRFEVKDSGIGITEEQQEAIFESFYQIPNKKAKKGTGLGLAIVKKLLELLGSKIQLTSEINNGSKFYFDITLKYPILSERKTTIVKRDEKSDAIPEKKVKILLVEDDEYVQTTLFKMLLNSKKFQIDLAFDGALVFQEVINNSYDIILMDVNLPHLDGIQLTKLIREFPFKNINRIPIIGITANAYQETTEQCLEVGMQKVLIKPFEKEALFDALSKHLK